MCLFEQDGDYAVFERVLGDRWHRVPLHWLGDAHAYETVA